MEKLLFKNAKNAIWVIGGFTAASIVMQMVFLPRKLKEEVFGVDGNGGKMLKIITDLTDEEIARLKFVRRMNWHWKGSRKLFQGTDTIND
jgi:hypothetical protein